MRNAAAVTSVLMPEQTPLETLVQCASGSAEQGGDAPLFGGVYPSLYYWLWLAEVLAPGHAHAGEVLDRFGDAANAYEMRETTEFESLVGTSAAKRARGMVINPDACAARLASCAQKDIAVLPFDDARYPVALLRIPDPPMVLYATGNVDALHATATVGMVGTRRPTAYGVDAAARFGGAFARSGAVIVSGLADGLDSESHKAAVAAHAPTIGVMGVPITKTFPATNATLRRQIEACGGVTLSEYPEGFASDYRHTFLQRNRIIAALSDALVVVEARSKSGTMSTVKHAERYGTPIYAIPGSVFSSLSEGTNALLGEGRAKILLHENDILSTLGICACEAPKAHAPAPMLSPSAKKALACIGATPTSFAYIGEQSGLSMGALLSALSSLELAGCIIALPGRQYKVK